MSMLFKYLLTSAVLATAAYAETHSSDLADLALSPPYYPSPWMDPKAPGWEDAYLKAKAFVSKLSLEEKVNLTTGTGWQNDKCVGSTGTVPRLGMNGLCLQDGPLGLRLSDYNSAFPTALTVGGHFSRHLWRDRGSAMGSEARGKGVDILLGPASGPLGRFAKGGRNTEGFGSDPYLQGQALANTVSGIQSAGVIACAKHYVGNEQEHFRQVGETAGRNITITGSLSSNIDDKLMHEYYAWPFQDAVKAGLGSVMCSYNQLNNSYACANSKALNGLLKDEYGFQGFVVSDWAAQRSGVSSALAGLDMTMPGDTDFNTGRSFWGSNLTLAAINGTVPAYRIDDMAMRIMAAFFKVGKTLDNQVEPNFSSWTRSMYGFQQFVAGENWGLLNQGVDVRQDHASHIRESAAKGTVILKNNGILPLKRPKFIGVIGEDAGQGSKGPNGCADRGCADGTVAMEWGSGTSNFPYLITPDTALQSQAIKDGTRYESILSNYETDAAIALVGQPNCTAIVFANADSGEGYIDIDGNAGDRKNMTLWKNGDDLILSVAAVNPNVIVVLHTPGAVILRDYHKHPNISAIVWAGQPGQESGNSLVDILYGKTSPGRSPFTWAASEQSYGNDVIYKPNNGQAAPQDDFLEGAFFDYRHFDREDAGKPGSSDKAPLYEFGFGLSWSTFEYSDLKVVKRSAGQYRPTNKTTIAAPTLSNFSTTLSKYRFPPTIRPIREFIYPWLSDTSSGSAASGDPDYGQSPDSYLPPHSRDSSPQPVHPAGGEPGGNRQLWDVLYEVTASIKNVGPVSDDEVPQLYISHGGEGEPVRVLRGFDRIEHIAPGQTVSFRAEITRRDLSNWDTVTQNWVLTEAPKTIWVGGSSRNLPLTAGLS